MFWSTRSKSPSDPGLTADGSMQDPGIPAAVVTKFLSARRIEIEKTGLYSFLVLFSMGITRGKWSTLVTELMNFKDLYDPILAHAGSSSIRRSASRSLHENGLEGPCERCTSCIARTICRGRRAPCIRRCPRWLCGRPMPTSAWCAGGGKRRNRRSDGSDFSRDGGSVSAGDTVIMPGERITSATKSIHDYLLYARDFDRRSRASRPIYMGLGSSLCRR